MEKREIDGKQFVEYEKHVEERKRMMIQIAFLIAIVLASASIIFAVKVILSNKDLIGSNPLTYGMEQYGFISCQCFDSQNVEWYSDGDGFVSKTQVDYGGEKIGAG